MIIIRNEQVIDPREGVRAEIPKTHVTLDSLLYKPEELKRDYENLTCNMAAAHPGWTRIIYSYRATRAEPRHPYYYLALTMGSIFLRAFTP